MTAEITEIKLNPLSVYGVIGTAMVPLATFTIIDVTKREETILDLLGKLADSEKLIIGNTLIFTESYDAFRIF